MQTLKLYFQDKVLIDFILPFFVAGVFFYYICHSAVMRIMILLNFSEFRPSALAGGFCFSGQLSYIWFMNYKLRADNDVDIALFIRALPAKERVRPFTLKYLKNFSGIEMAFEVTTMNLDDLRKMIRKIPDSTTMLQTVMPATLYTGNRNIDIV